MALLGRILTLKGRSAAASPRQPFATHVRHAGAYNACGGFHTPSLAFFTISATFAEAVLERVEPSQGSPHVAQMGCVDQACSH